MSVVASNLIGLDAKASVTEATIGRTRLMVRRRRNATATVLWILIILVGLHRLRRRLDWIRSTVPDISVETDEERRSVRNIAIELGRATAALDAVHEEYESISPSYRSGSFVGSLWPRVARKVEDLACMSEDVAETLALAADQSFSRRIQEELARAVPHDGQVAFESQAGSGRDVCPRDSAYRRLYKGLEQALEEASRPCRHRRRRSEGVRRRWLGRYEYADPRFE